MMIKTTGDKMKRAVRQKMIPSVVCCFPVLTTLLV